ncbi:hypothetical protein Daus18300_002600 [Diaporthe australafricana]|uniref:Telomeric single stranded DNA binding POT1/Cdc13 domain-containing protein n=1 Tax=Diaporthe australafricana TaxID=127596 RepID=A0ABR3XLW9_9PEZI
MSVSDPPPETAVVAADPTKPFEPRALIYEILRTRHCVPGSILLVENIEAHVPVSKRYRTVRLLLGDGDLCIQALLRSEMHRFVDTGRIFVGCYVRLIRFDVQSVELQPGNGDDDSGDPVDMVYLIVKDMATVGWNTPYMQMAGTTGQEQSHAIIGTKALSTHYKTSLGTSRTNPGVAATRARIEAADSPVTKQDEEPKSDEEDAFESRQVSQQTVNERREEAKLLQQHSSYPASSTLPWASGTLSKPLKLTALKSIPHLPYKQNWTVNILAVVTWLSEVEPALLPGYVGKQRAARLADRSTDKQVLLTVFLDPDEFTPDVGGVVLLLGVKNHRFDGGSLKKYGNEKPRAGTNWWFQNPTDVDWCDAEGLKEWWSGKHVDET